MQKKTVGFHISPHQRSLLEGRTDLSATARFTLELPARLEPARLREALRKMVARHEILATRYHRISESAPPVMVVEEDNPWDMVVLVETESESRTNGPGVDPESGPTLSVRMNDRGETGLLEVEMPRLSMDASTPLIFAEELTRCYRAGDEDLDDAPMQFIDYAEWQHENHERERNRPGENYWRSLRLERIPALSLPRAGQRPPGIHQARTRVLAGSPFDGESAPVFLLVCWNTLLARWCRSPEFLTAVYFPGRSFAELDATLGPVGRHLPVDGSFLPEQRVTAAVAALQNRLGEADHFQDGYFEDVARAPKEMGSGFEYHRFPIIEREIARFSPQPHILTGEQFPLRLICTSMGTDLHLSLAWGAGIDSAWATRLFQGFQALLADAVRHGNRKLGDLAIMAEEERERLLVAFNAVPQARASGHDSLHAAFSVRARRSASDCASVMETESMTFAELERQADLLSLELRARGARPGQRVAVFMERSAALPMALMAVWKAGAAYVPLNPADPPDRLAYYLRDSGARMVLASRNAPWRPLRAACADDAVERLVAEVPGQRVLPAGNPVAPTHPDRAAYAIYTSGTSGRPKGVTVSHRAALNLLAALEDRIYRHLGNRALRVSLNAPISFDASLQQVLMLLAGHCICIVPEQTRLDGDAMTEYLARHRIQVLDCTPTHLALLVEAGLLDRDDLALECILSAGGPIGPLMWRRLAAASRIRSYNIYGPTECTVDATACLVTDSPELPSLGRPLANYRLYLLDERLHPVAAGTPGEIFIAGTGLARGYHRRARLTASVFLPEPFSGIPGERIYRSGDRAQFLENGALQFLNRGDLQVKIRGVRVELEEIEYTLVRYPEIVEACVVARPCGETGSEAELIAYYRTRQEHGLSASALADFLRQSLLEAMVPSRFVELRRFPLKANGKIDRGQLPEPEGSREQTLLLPRTATEEMLCEIWKDVLGRFNRDIHANFFDLGGHSLLVTRVVARIRNLFAMEFSIQDFFQHATVAELAERIAHHRAPDRPDTPPLRALPPQEEDPLSFAQERLWLLYNLEGAQSAYNLLGGIRLAGNLRVAALGLGLEHLAERHEALRTLFRESNGQPKRRILERPNLDLTVIDLSGQPKEEREQYLQGYFHLEGSHRFDLARGPLLRLTLIRLDERDHAMFINMHHIVSDGWSVPILIRELGLLYNSRVSGRPAELPKISIRYGDYAHWQKRLFREGFMQRHLDYWLNQLGGDLPIQELPTDYPRPAQFGYRGRTLAFTYEERLSRRLSDFCRRQNQTMFMTLMAAFQVLLHRYSGQRDILVGTPVANRTHHELENQVGFFVNTLVIRTDFGGEPSFLELVDRVRHTSLEAFDHQELPFEKLVEALNPVRDLSRTPLFQTMFVFQNDSRTDFELIDLATKPMNPEVRTSKFDLTLELSPGENGLNGRLEYCSALFHPQTIAGLRDHLEVLLEGILERPETPCGALPIMTERERRLMLDSWNETERLGVKDALYQERFERRAALNPEQTALTGRGRTLTYGALNRRANRMARRLSELAVGPETRVVLLAERGVDFIAGLVGIIKSGGVILSLDPHQPVDRLARIVGLSHAALLVVADSCQALARELSAAMEGTPPRTLSLETLLQGAGEAQNPVRRASGSCMVYMVFTSGTTGVPKGAMVVHEGFINHQLSKNWDLRISDRDVVAQTARQSFDISYWQCLAGFLSGAWIRVFDEEEVVDPGRLLAGVERCAITLLQVVPSFLRFMIPELDRMGKKSGPGALRLLLSTGEALPPDLARQWLVRFPGIPIVNFFGPTECSDDVAQFVVEKPPGDGVVNMPIGRPVMNTRIYVADPNLRPVPVGVPGELLAGGAGVGRGYFDRPGRTAQTYVPDPFDGIGQRLYRTGDLVRFLRNGNLEYLGRLDFQVKVRGFRIELGEIEAALKQHEDIHQAVVVAGTYGAMKTETHLVAYLTCHRELDTETLGDYLAASLPGYMVPSFFVVLDAMPVNANGKLDRKALPPPKIESQVASMDFDNPTEALIAANWCEILGVPAAGRRDNFFESGGHSLLATQMVSRIRDAFSIELPLQKLFELPTIEQLAVAVENTRHGHMGILAPPLMPMERPDHPPLSYAQQSLWLQQELDPESPAYNLAAAFRLRGPLDIGVFEATVRAIADRHETLRSYFPTVAGRPYQAVYPPGLFQLSILDLGGLSRPEEIALALAKREATAPFRLATGPLLRVRLLRLGPGHHTCLFTMHHIVSDGWSLGVLINEMTLFYAALVKRRVLPRKALALQYIDYALWQRSWLDGPVMESHLGFWRETLAQPLPATTLPPDHPRPPVLSDHGESRFFTLDQSLVENLKSLSRLHGCTLFMTLYAALCTLLFHYTRERDLVIGTDVAGRQYSKLERLIGYFVNPLVLRCDLAGIQRFPELLERVRKVVLDAYDHQLMPFQELVKALNPPRDRSRTPLFQVNLLLQNVPEEKLTLPGLDLSLFPVVDNTSKFDLFLDIREVEGALEGRVEFNRDLYESATISVFTEKYRDLLAKVCTEAEPSLEELDRHLKKQDAERRADALKSGRAAIFGKGLRQRRGSRS